MVKPPAHVAKSHVMRLLGADRLSLLAGREETATGPERNRELIELTVNMRGDRLIGYAVDTDTSGAVSVFKREDLGPWLTDPAKIALWDGIIVAKIDRLSRSLLDWAKFIEWCDEHNKTVISVGEGFDLGTPIGRLVANILIMFAEFERLRIGERRADAAAKLRKVGRWNGGRVPWYMIAKEGTEGVILFQNPDTAPIVRRIINDKIGQIVDGKLTRMPLSQICQWLTDEDIPTPRGAKAWTVRVLTDMLTSRYLRGELQYQGHSVLDEAGQPVMITEEPLITEHEWSLLQEALKADARPRGYYQRTAFHMMLRLAYCGECDSPWYHQHNGGNDYYRCNGWRTGGHRIPSMRAEALETMQEDCLLRLYGDHAIERRVSTGKDYGREIAMAERELEELEEEYLAHRLSAERFARMSTRFEVRLAELRHLAETSSGPTWEPTGETVRERWQRSGAEERHVMLTRLGLRWLIYRQCRISDHAWRWYLEADWLPEEDAHERLTRQAA